MPRALILDFGEVLVRSQPAAAIAEMAALTGLGVDAFRQRYWQHRRAYDSGLAADRYWRRVVDEPPPVSALNDVTLAALKAADVRSWTDYRDSMWTMAAEFRRRGGRTAILSNGVPEVMARVRAERVLAEYFDTVLVSYEVGVTKPDARIYELCVQRLGVPAASSLFVDDRVENVEAARQFGIASVLFHGDESVDEVRMAVEETRRD